MATLAALRLVMTSVIHFGNINLAPPAVAYAKLYLHERVFCADFSELLFYSRFIDDVIGIWSPSTYERWEEFRYRVNDYGALRWEFTDLARSINFLDLTVSLSRLHER